MMNELQLMHAMGETENVFLKLSKIKYHMLYGNKVDQVLAERSLHRSVCQLLELIENKKQREST